MNNDLEFVLSQKYIDFCNTIENVDVDVLEGTTASGKTTIAAGIKFMRMVSASNKKQHIIASRTVGTAEKNIINSENGITVLQPGAQYLGNGDKDNKFPHIKFEGKTIYVLGYDTKDKWENALGGQYGCVYIDEVNTADIEFVREILTRNDYLCVTLNPDDPKLPIYNELINRARPYKKYEKDVPNEIMQELLKVAPLKNARYWFFTFYDNAGLTEEQIEKKKSIAPPGTKLHKNKIQGLRGKATGLVFNVTSENIINEVEAKQYDFINFSIGVDTSYSRKTHDKLTMEFVGITANRKCILLEEEVYNNKDATVPFAPSDVIPKIVAFAEKCKIRWGFALNIYIDSADSGTIEEARKYKREVGCIYNFVGAWKKTKNVTRVQLEQSWLKTRDFLIVDTCTNYLEECDTYSYTEEGELEDGNDHSIQGGQYGWLPHKKKIGNWEVIKDLIKDADDEGGN